MRGVQPHRFVSLLNSPALKLDDVALNSARSSACRHAKRGPSTELIFSDSHSLDTELGNRTFPPSESNGCLHPPSVTTTARFPHKYSHVGPIADQRPCRGPLCTSRCSHSLLPTFLYAAVAHTCNCNSVPVNTFQVEFVSTPPVPLTLGHPGSAAKSGSRKSSGPRNGKRQLPHVVWSAARVGRTVPTPRKRKAAPSVTSP